MPEAENSLPVLIMGQGLAGSCLALQLFQCNVPFRVVDVPRLSNSSKVAAGLLNPLIFRYYTLSWRAVNYLDYSKEFYRKFALVQGISLLHEIPLLRIFGRDESVLWSEKAIKAPFSKFMNPQIIADLDDLRLEFGAGIVSAAAWIDTALFVSEVRQFLKSRNLLMEHEWDYARIASDDASAAYDGTPYRCIVFCEGYRAKHNPFLAEIPFRPVKGDVITVRISNFRCNYIINKNFFLVPLGHDMFRLGSSYVWDFEDEQPDPEAAQKLLTDLKTFINKDVDVIQHQAGIRPAIADRRPVAGRIPGFNNLFVFNGLGSRGGLLAPPLAHYMANLISGNNTTDPEVEPSRFLRSK